MGTHSTGLLHPSYKRKVSVYRVQVHVRRRETLLGILPTGLEGTE